MITRFAPSPTGPLHLGHAYSALLAHDWAMENGGDFLLRIEDIDQSRARPEWEAQIYDDLAWLGLWWPEPVMRQSDRMDVYRKKLDYLWGFDYAYACSCSRRDIEAAASAPQEGAPIGPDGLIYPGTCRDVRSLSESVPRPPNTSLRLWLKRTSIFMDTRPGEGQVLSFNETGHGPNGETGLIEFTLEDAIRDIGDFVIERRDMGSSYHLSVVLDDAAQGVTHVVRGQDMFEATKIHVILQKFFRMPTPTYHHHPLIRDETGKRLAKRDDARAISKYREDGASPEDIRAMVGL